MNFSSEISALEAMNMTDLDPGSQENVRKRLELLKEMQQHVGHESEHSYMLLIIILCIIIGQVGVIYWKKAYPKAFHLYTLIGLFIVPFILCVVNVKTGEAWYAGITKHWLFISVWLIFTIGNYFIINKAMSKPLHQKTPRLVFKWFRNIYTICYSGGILGYLLMLSEIFGISYMFITPDDKGNTGVFSFGFNLLMFGLYFGVLGRDVVDILSETMAANLGYYNKDGFPKKHLRQNVCSICGGSISPLSLIAFSSASQSEFINSRPSKSNGNSPVYSSFQEANQMQNSEIEENERSYELDCRHSFHESCIRGWCLIGKKEMCPYCKEKVDMKLISGSHPWETSQQLYVQMLDWLRYLVVFQPIVLMGAQIIIHLFGLH